MVYGLQGPSQTPCKLWSRVCRDQVKHSTSCGLRSTGTKLWPLSRTTRPQSKYPMLQMSILPGALIRHCIHLCLSVTTLLSHLFLSVCFHLTSFCPSVSTSPLSVRLFPPHLFLSVCFLLTSFCLFPPHLFLSVCFHLTCFCPSVSTSPLSVRLFPPHLFLSVSTSALSVRLFTSFCLPSFRPSVYILLSPLFLSVCFHRFFASLCPSVSTLCSPLSVRLFPHFCLTSSCPSVSNHQIAWTLCLLPVSVGFIVV